MAWGGKDVWHALLALVVVSMSRLPPRHTTGCHRTADRAGVLVGAVLRPHPVTGVLWCKVTRGRGRAHLVPSGSVPPYCMGGSLGLVELVREVVRGIVRDCRGDACMLMVL